MMLRGYRSADADRLHGPWPADELLGLPDARRPALAMTTTLDPPIDHDDEVCLAPGAVVRFGEIDWVSRRTRLQIGVHPDGDPSAVLTAAVRHAFGPLNLNRIYGWVTPSGRTHALLTKAGFRLEATIPDAGWLDGRPVEREIWGVLRER